MLKNKAIFALGATFLFLAVAMVPASANVTQDKLKLCCEEYELVSAVLNDLMNKIEGAESYKEILEIIKDFCSVEIFGRFPILKDLFVKIVKWVFSQRSLFFGGSNIGRILNNKLSNGRSKEKFIISFGSYQKRLLDKKDEKISLFKQGFAFWRYSGRAKLSKGRTLIVDREPFGIQDRVRGSQIGIMLGFSGLFIDVKSKLTGNSYVFIMGNARRAKALDLHFLTPFSN